MIEMRPSPQRDYDLRIGIQSPADLLVIPGCGFSRLENIVLNPPAERIVIKRGQLVARRRLETTVL
jgi:hypothetical protein